MKGSRRWLSLFLALVLVTVIMPFSASASGNLKLPNGLKRIEKEAFYGDKTFSTVVLPDGLNVIESLAFGQTNLNSIHLPSSINFIANDAFSGANIGTLTADSGSYAYDWAVEQGYIVPPSISVTHQTLGDLFEAGTFEMWNGSATQTWTVTSNCAWTISKSGSWFTVDKTSGSAGTSTIKLTISSGVNAGESRTGSVTFKVNGSNYRTIRFMQQGNQKALTVTHALLGDIIAASPVQMYNGAAHQTWTVTSNADWTLKKSGTWFSVDKTSGSVGTETIVLTFPDGVDQGDSRSGTLNFYFGSSLYATISIYQDGGADTDPLASISVVHPWVGDVLDVDTFNLTNSVGQSSNWTVFSNFDWTITTTGDWFTVSRDSGSANTKTTLTITTTDYAPSGYNSGKIVFKKGSSTKATVYLRQGEGYSTGDYDDSFTVNHPMLGNILEQDTLYMHNGSSYQTWTVVSNVEWSLTQSGSWFTVSPTSGDARSSTDVRLTFSSGVAAGESREGSVKFTYYIDGRKKTSTVYIAQDGGPGDPTPKDSLAASHALLGDVFKASPIEMHNGTGAVQNWTITSNKSWSIQTSGNWFTVSPTSGSANTSSNPTTNVRITLTDYARPGTKNSGTITFYVDGTKYKTVSIFQDGGVSADPSITLSSPNFGNVFSLSSVTLENVKKTYSWTLYANSAWSVSKTGSWFSVTPASGTAGANTTLNITVSSLPSAGETLTGSLKFLVGGSLEKEVVLKIISDSSPSAPSASGGFVTSQAGLNYIKQREGLHLSTYTDPVGVPTIGYGHTGTNVVSGMTITEAQAEAYLKSDMADVENTINNFIKSNGIYLTQCQFDAIASLCMNAGTNYLTKNYKLHKTLLKYKNGTSIPITEAFRMFGAIHHGKGKCIDGLFYRRCDEGAMFYFGTYQCKYDWSTDYSWYGNSNCSDLMPDDWYPVEFGYTAGSSGTGGGTSPATAKDPTLPKDFDTRVADYEDIFVDGKYWNHVNITADTYSNAGTDRNNIYNMQVTDYPCNSSGQKLCHTHGSCNYYGKCGCNSWGSAIQCMGFAKMMCELLTDHPTSEFTQVYRYSGCPGATVLQSVIRKGDMIRIGELSGGNGHNFVITAVSWYGVNLVECNKGGNCQVAWVTLSWYELNNRFDDYSTLGGAVYRYIGN